MGNSGSSSSSSFADTALKVGALVAAAGTAVWTYRALYGAHDTDDRKPDSSAAGAHDIDDRKPDSSASGAHDTDDRKPAGARDTDDRKPYSSSAGVHDTDDRKPDSSAAPRVSRIAKKRPPKERGYELPITTSDRPRKRRTIKLMCYNVWCREVKLQERMKAINQLIQKHSPDIILLQEVTPFIYKIFQDCNWWGMYMCSVQPEKVTSLNFFCMLLSKLPAKKSTYVLFKSGKGLSVASIDVGEEKKLVIATCHLKRITDSDTNSTERIAQAKEALSLLHLAPNVVLGGDMNWNEQSDGPFPLLGGWYDAWSVLRPGENGWTYDTESNGMLRSSRSVQGRLDRFLCKLQDFEIVSIGRIGMDAIPGISSENNRGDQLPVLPSDHYGLILTICLK